MESTSTLEPVVVAVRVRPLGESKENDYSVIQQLPNETKILLVAGKGFAFDHVFTEKSEQSTIYEEAVKPAIGKLFAGFNCAVIAYGHTGTGKTYTIGTDPKKCGGESAGIISRAVEEVISELNCDEFVEISFMEIYNEDVYDLLTSQPDKLPVQAFNVQSLSRKKVTRVKEAIHYLEVGSSNRHTRATTLNAQSSRSHAIFSIYYQRKIEKEQSLVSKLDIVDLAGSEGVRHTNSKGEALTEGSKINHGLLNLRNVISILSTNSKDYVPYRSSTLTSVLKDSLSRESYVTMIACISSSHVDVSHTINTLRFAEEAKKVMSKPKMNQKLQNFKVANPQLFENFAKLAPQIPPTPVNRNLYKVNQTPLTSTFKMPMMQLNNLSSTSYSSADLQDSMIKSRMNTIMETQNNSTVFSVSDVSSSRMDTSDMTSVLSPLLRKHLTRFQNQLQEKLNSTILMSQQRLRAPGGREQNYTGSPVFEHDRDMRKILSVTECTERSFRNELKHIKAELKSYVVKEMKRIHQSDVTSREESGARVPQKKLKHNLLYTDKDSSHEENFSASSDGKSIRRPEKQLTRSSTPFAGSLTYMDSSSSGSSDECPGTVRQQISKQPNYRTCAYSSTPEDEIVARIQDNVTVRRSKRLSTRNISQGNLSLMDISTVTTVKRNQQVRRVLEVHETDKSIVCNNSQTGKDHVFSPSRTSTVRRSMRLSIRPRRVYKDETPSPFPQPQRSRRKSKKPALAASPSDVSSKAARDNFRRKVLQMLNGSFKDLTKLVTVGEKTALIIYNYRLLNDCKFKNFRDLKNIPGLSATYYKRFMKANNLF